MHFDVYKHHVYLLSYLPQYFMPVLNEIFVGVDTPEAFEVISSIQRVHTVVRGFYGRNYTVVRGLYRARPVLPRAYLPRCLSHNHLWVMLAEG
jgi:hypothetical protein